MYVSINLDGSESIVLRTLEHAVTVLRRICAQPPDVTNMQVALEIENQRVGTISAQWPEPERQAMDRIRHTSLLGPRNAEAAPNREAGF